MKKTYLLILSLVLLFALCGCSEGINPTTKNISFKAHITYYDKAYVCPTVITGDGSVISEIESPETLAGMRFIFSEGKSAVEYKGMRYDFGEDNGFYSINDKLCRVLLDCTERKIPKSKENFTLNGETAGERYSIVFAPSGLPLSMEIGEAKIELQDMTVNTP